MSPAVHDQDASTGHPARSLIASTGAGKALRSARTGSWPCHDRARVRKDTVAMEHVEREE